MSLTQQFLITLTLPAAFVVILIYYLRGSGRTHRGQGESCHNHADRYWRLLLLAATLWSTCILSFYGGATLPQEVAYLWRALARHALSLLSLFMLLTTAGFLGTPRQETRGVLPVSMALWIAAIVLDPALWGYNLAPWQLGDLRGGHFELWAGAWVVSWFLPWLASLMLVQRARSEVQSALYRNRLNYWLLTLLLFGAGSGLAMVQQPRQPLWQELGALGLIFATAIGSLTLTRSDLLNLRLALRQGVARLTTTLLIFGLTWLALWYFATNMAPRTNLSTVLDLIFVAGLFTIIIMAVNRYVPMLIRRLFLPTTRSHVTALVNQSELTAGLLDPTMLGDLLLRLVQFNLSMEKGQLLLALDSPGGGVRLEPLAALGNGTLGGAVQIAPDSPFAHHLRRKPPQPLSTYEIEALPAFETMRLTEKEALRQVQSGLFMPLNAGEELVAVLALGEKYTGQAYNHSDFRWLQEMATYAGPLLWQAQNLQSLQELNSYAFREMYKLAQEKQQLEELLHLHERFTEMVSPSLREPFRGIQSAVQDVEAAVAENGSQEALDSLNRELAQMRLIVNNLILTADRVQKQRDFYLLDVDLSEVIEQALNNLSSMAEARNVRVDVDVDSHLPLVRGDQQRLTEAIQYLLHNAIKFNKIGGEVTVECGADGHEIYLHIRDSGVGIRADRLPEVWQGLAELSIAGEKGGMPRLGLVLARFIVRAHGGRVEASSEYGSGSTFSVYLPMASNE